MDPLANTVKDKFVNGVRCEVAEAVSLPEGQQVVWRISGVAQCAENAHDLEVARMRNVHQVNLGTLKVCLQPNSLWQPYNIKQNSLNRLNVYFVKLYIYISYVA